MSKAVTIRQRLSRNGTVVLPQAYRAAMGESDLVDIRILGDTVVISRSALTFTKGAHRLYGEQASGYRGKVGRR